MFKKNKKYDEIIKKIKKYEKIICVRHINPDGDSYGSSMGFAQFIRENFKNKKVYVDGKNVDYLNFLGKNDVLYKTDYIDALVIVFDTSIKSRIDSEFWHYGKEIIKIDHHIHSNIEDEKFAHFEIIEDTVISTCQIVAKIIFQSKLKISKETAKLLYTGIVTDSGRFRFNNTNSDTFKVASKLLDTKLNINEIYNKLYIHDLDYLKVQKICISKIKTTKAGIGYIFFTNEDLEKDKLLKPENIKLHLNIMNNIKEIKIWLLGIEDKKYNCIKISIRSSKYIINEVAIKYNGGGHKLSSGCKINDWKESINLLNDLDQIIKLKKII